MSENDITKYGFERFEHALMNIGQEQMSKIFERPEGYEQIIKGIKYFIFEEPGESHYQPDLSPLDIQFKKLFLGFREIEISYSALLDIPKYLSKFPTESMEITGEHFLLYHLTIYLNEVYILKERLKQYCTVITRVYKHEKKQRIIKTSIEKAKSILVAFDDIINLRGQHVHSAIYEDEDLERLKFFKIFNELQEPNVGELY